LEVDKDFLPIPYRVRRVAGADFPLTECAGVHLASKRYIFLLLLILQVFLSTKELGCKSFY
jgi:hypothetical protein